MAKDYAVFLDVDGVVNSLVHLHWGGKVEFGVDATVRKAGVYNIWIPDYMPDLVQAIYRASDLYWLTTWRHEANTHISQMLGIPDDIPVLEDGTTSRYVNWKFPVAKQKAQEINGRQKILWIEDFGRNFGRPEHMTELIEYVDTDEWDEGVLLPQHLPGHFFDHLLDYGYNGPPYVERPRSQWEVHSNNEMLHGNKG